MIVLRTDLEEMKKKVSRHEERSGDEDGEYRGRGSNRNGRVGGEDNMIEVAKEMEEIEEVEDVKEEKK